MKDNGTNNWRLANWSNAVASDCGGCLIDAEYERDEATGTWVKGSYRFKVSKMWTPNGAVKGPGAMLLEVGSQSDYHDRDLDRNFGEMGSDFSIMICSCTQEEFDGTEAIG